MKVYALLGFIDWEGSRLIGVFGSVEDVLRCVESGKGSWWYDQMGYVESELGLTVVGDQIQDMESAVEYIEFHRGNSVQ